MGICRFCCQKAGWLSEVHEACVAFSQGGCELITSFVTSAITDRVIPPAAHADDDVWCSKLLQEVWSELSRAVERITHDHRIPSEDVHKSLVEGWSIGAEKVAFAQPVPLDRQVAIINLYLEMGLSHQEMIRTSGLKALNFGSSEKIVG